MSPMNGGAWPATIEWTSARITALDLALFAAASGDHNLLHLDVAAAEAAGFDKPLVHGMLTMAYAAQLCSTHFGAGSVRALQTRFTGVAKLGDALVMSAALAQDDGDTAIYDLAAHTKAGSALMLGTARVMRRAVD